MAETAYAPLAPDSLPARLGEVAPIRAALGDPAGWTVR